MSSTKEHQKENPFQSRHSKLTRRFDEPTLFTALPTFTTEAPANSFNHLLSEESTTHSLSSKNEYIKNNQKQSIDKCFKWCSKGSNGQESCKSFCIKRDKDQASWNPFNGVSLRYTESGDDQQDTHGSTTSNAVTTTSAKNPSEYQVDLGNSVQHVKDHFKKILTPGYELGCRYIMSWKDGSQAAFFERLKENVKQGEAWILAKGSVLKMIETIRSERK
ncbi:hypothetical protein K7432_008914 [Basidiobolus ranarum]|uniref:Uncharacterized protein n=1 Tax=Basidiobolus ranarum TaxID=34480 RepID=A0ABR2VY77_9FUNG